MAGVLSDSRGEPNFLAYNGNPRPFSHFELLRGDICCAFGCLSTLDNARRLFLNLSQGIKGENCENKRDSDPEGFEPRLKFFPPGTPVATVRYKEAERLCRELDYKKGLARALGCQALILKGLDDLDGATGLLKDAERIYRGLGDKDGLQRTLGNRAVILQARGESNGAMLLHKMEEHLCHELGNKDGLQASLGNQALILRARGDWDGAMTLLKEKQRLCDEIGDSEGIANSLANQAELLSGIPGRSSDARRLAGEALSIANCCGYRHIGLQFRDLRDSIPTDPI